MKTYLLTFSLMLAASTANAQAIRETGGTSPAPRAVVIQAHLDNGAFDLEGRQKALALAADYLAADQVVAVTQRAALQDAARTYLCVEFKDFKGTQAASDEFRKALAAHKSMEVVSNSTCK